MKIAKEAESMAQPLKFSFITKILKQSADVIRNAFHRIGKLCIEVHLIIKKSFI